MIKREISPGHLNERLFEILNERLFEILNDILIESQSERLIEFGLWDSCVDIMQNIHVQASLGKKAKKKTNE